MPFNNSPSTAEGQPEQEQPFGPAKFIDEQVPMMRKFVGSAKAAVATSGGVDSTACAALAHMALGRNLVCFFLDTGFMREGEVGEVMGMLKSLNLPLKILTLKERFLRRLEGKTDAESKRLAFRETFYTSLGEAMKAEGCQVLIQGTIAPDWIETSGGIKTQHNVLEQLGVNTVSSFGFRLLEPLLDLYKDQVRALARHLGVKESERQPFPGPGLMVRCIGKVTEEKLDVLRRATAITENCLAKMEPPPKQYLAAVTEDDRLPSATLAESLGSAFPGLQVEYLGALVTGVKGDDRAYGKMVVASGGAVDGAEPRALFGLPAAVIHADKEVVRVLYAIAQAEVGRGIAKMGIGRHVLIVRAVETRDFMTAKPSEVPRSLLESLAGKVLEDGRVSLVAYDLTSKPPATVEFE